MKLEKFFWVGIMLLSLSGCKVIPQPPNMPSKSVDFKIFPNGKISFYGNFPKYDSWIIVDCDFVEDCQWHLTVRNFDSNQQHEMAFVDVIEAMIIHIETFLIKHTNAPRHIGGITFSSEDLSGYISDKDIEFQKKHIHAVVSSLRSNLWKRGIRFQLPLINYDKTDNVFNISMWSVDTEDLTKL